jgi:hypothetical protein
MKPTSTQTIRYSPRPKETYQGSLEGTRYGPATSTLLDTQEAWNLAYLSHDFEKVLMHKDPYFTTNVRRTTQTLLDGSGLDLTGSSPLSRHVASLLRAPAPRFVYLIQRHAVLTSLPMYTAYGEAWLATIEARARICGVDDWEPDKISDLTQAKAVLALLT